MTTAAIYARVSSARQREEQTIASQTAALIEYAANTGLDLGPDWVFEDDGYSGATLVRPALERLRDLVAEVGVDVVLCYSPDRLARKYVYQALLIEELGRLGTEVRFLRGPKTETPEDALLVQFQGMIAEYERAQIVERTRRGKVHRARTGSVNVLSGAPYGYRYVRKNESAEARFEILEPQASVVREIFRLYTEEMLSIGEIARQLTRDRFPTATGKANWDRSTVWGTLRNPAYTGHASFAKTTRTDARPALTRRPRLAGRRLPERPARRDRAPEEWIGIPVPAIIGEDVFAMAARRLDENKRFAARNTKEPSLLQGLLVCEHCGYAYYRTSTRTSARKLYYYRCLGSDDYRYPQGRICDTRPLRQDALDALVWRQVSELLADPALIRGEIERRLAELRQTDPTNAQQARLERELARVTTASRRLVEAYQEDLLSLDELRSRVPELRKKESSLRAQLDALAADAVDRETYLALVEDLEGFLARLQEAAASSSVEDRQKVLRLVVREVLVGRERIVIRHSVPISRVDHPPGLRLRGSRQDATLGCTGDGVFLAAEFGQETGLEERLDQGQDLLVLDPSSHSVHEGRVRDLVEARLDVRLQYPLVGVDAVQVDVRDGVAGPSVGAEPVRGGLEARLEDGLEHQLERCLHHPVSHGPDAQPPELAVGLGDHPLPDA
jgi:site-specific DNA recombinase